MQRSLRSCRPLSQGSASPPKSWRIPLWPLAVLLMNRFVLFTFFIHLMLPDEQKLFKHFKEPIVIRLFYDMNEPLDYSLSFVLGYVVQAFFCASKLWFISVQCHGYEFSTEEFAFVPAILILSRNVIVMAMSQGFF